MVVVFIVIDRRHFAHQHVAKAAFTPETVVQAGRQADAFPRREAQLATGRVRLPTAVYRDDHVGVFGLFMRARIP